ncbi:MAG TPA: metalloregulator ArsR/SmtB family transcription factor [Sphingomonas sp.]
MKQDSPLDKLRDHATDAAATLRILANPDRLLMLCRMSTGEVSVGELVDLTGLAQPTVSQHLSVLREAGAVAPRAEAQTRFYRIADEQVTAIIDALCRVYGSEK